MTNPISTPPLRGLRCNILRADKFPDCSMNGISSHVHQVTLVGPGIDRVFDATREAPAVVLVKRNFGDGDYLHVVPLEIVERGEHAMAGGTFIWTSDGRFPNDYPLSLHDRVEHPMPQTPAAPKSNEQTEPVARCSECPAGKLCAGGDLLGTTYYCDEGHFYADGDDAIKD